MSAQTCSDCVHNHTCKLVGRPRYWPQYYMKRLQSVRFIQEDLPPFSAIDILSIYILPSTPPNHVKNLLVD